MKALTNWLHRMFNTQAYQNRVSIELSEKMHTIATKVIMREYKPGGILWKIRNGIA
ncbi:hypothetical protein [Rhodanobacter lindaniclasticus]|uniref:hypothetical protein n=1 Tax=Rhodanobacter lindaniclasticus TaxID=75310 RepID=UPI00144695B8|nr:hypothetical protein [Rhodanobacter lindaniclasticus]